MNYGKKKAAKRQKQITSKSAMQAKRVGVRLFKALLLCIIVVAIAGVAGGGLFVKKIIDNSPDITPDDVKPQGFTTLVYADDGTTEIERFVAAGSNRVYKTIDEIPADLQHAFVAIEDERFYEHNGIDIQGILRAFVNGVSHGFHFNEGASTLTQQLLKNNVFTNWTNEGKIERFKRKIQEQYLALQLEASLTAEGMDTKSVILENYLNTINLSAGTYGVQAAAQRYFGKNSEDLTLSECAVLAAIPQNPYAYNPIRFPEENAKRRKKVLTNMLDQGYITKAQYEEALADNVYERIQATDSSQETATPYSYFIDELTSQIITDLQEQKGYTKVQAQNALYSGGLRIYTTQDPSIQSILDEEYQNEENFPAHTQVGIDWALTVQKADGTTQNYSKEMMKLYFKDHGDENFDLLFDSEEEAQNYVDQYKAAVVGEGETIVAERISFAAQPQSSMVIIDQHTGYVKAVVGGGGAKTASLTLNRATDTYRQPGSTFKPLAVYGPAINDLGLTLADTYVDQAITYENTNRPVKNAYSGYRGTMTIRDALKYSCNTIAVQCFRDITPRLGYTYLKELGFDKVTDHEVINGQVYDDAREPTALGGITNGVSTLELTAAYATIANGGTYTKPIFYTKILDQNGDVVLENKPQTTEVFRESTAYLLTSALESVVNDEGGTGNGLQLDNMPVAGKTGTTSATRDVWFAGFTPYYTCAVWAGYDTNEFLEDDCKSFHKTLWKKVMSRIHEDLPHVDFEMPSTVKEATICTSSGLLAGSGCPTRTEYFETSTIPTVRCTRHYVAPTPSPWHSHETDPSDSDEDADTDTDGTDTNGDGTDTVPGDDSTVPAAPDDTAPVPDTPATPDTASVQDYSAG